MKRTAEDLEQGNNTTITEEEAATATEVKYLVVVRENELCFFLGSSFYFISIGSISPNPFDLNDMGSNLQQPMMSSSSTTPTPGGLGGANGGAIGGAKPKKSVQTLLGEHSKLVNLDNLVSESSKTGKETF